VANYEVIGRRIYLIKNSGNKKMLEQKSLARIIILHLIAVLFVIINISDIRVAGLSNIIPLFDLMMIFYFTIFKKTFGIWFIFILGVWSDALNGIPLGTTALCYIVLIKFFLLLNNRVLLRDNFKQVWQQFVAFCGLFLLLKWLILSIFAGTFYSFTTPLIHLVLSSVLYVLMHKFFDYLSQKLLSDN
jgi:cell shape-determining protein MreD